MADPTDNNPAPNPPADPPADPPQNPPAPSFNPVTSQEQFDRMVQERLARERAKFSDYDDAKKKATEFDKLQKANQSELEKAQTAATEAAAERDKLKTDLQESRLKTRVVAEAAKRNVVDPDAALALLDRSSLEYDDDGTPNNITKVMDSLLEAKPYLQQQGSTGAKPGGADQGVRPGAPKQLTSTKNMSSEEIAKALTEGRLDNYLQAKN